MSAVFSGYFKIHDNQISRYQASIDWRNVGKQIGITIYCTKICPLLEYASPVWGGLPKYLAEELQSIQNRCLDIVGIPRTSFPTLEGRCKVAAKRELERIVNYINHSNQYFSQSKIRRQGYNLRCKPGSVTIPKLGTQRLTNSFLARAARLLLLWSVHCYLPLLEIIVHSICFSPLIM